MQIAEMQLKRFLRFLQGREFRKMLEHELEEEQYVLLPNLRNTSFWAALRALLHTVKLSNNPPRQRCSALSSHREVLGKDHDDIVVPLVSQEGSQEHNLFLLFECESGVMCGSCEGRGAHLLKVAWSVSAARK